MRNPTIKQKALVQNLAESLKPNSKKESYKDLLLKSGYTEVTAKEPGRILVGKGFQETIARYGITDEKLATRLGEGLDANKKDAADHNVRHKYLETALDLKGYRAKEQRELDFIAQAEEFEIVLEKE